MLTCSIIVVVVVIINHIIIVNKNLMYWCVKFLDISIFNINLIIHNNKMLPIEWCDNQYNDFIDNCLNYELILKITFYKV